MNVVNLPPKERDNLFPPSFDWSPNRRTKGYYPAWAWSFTLDQITENLGKRIRVSELIVESDKINLEIAYGAAFALFRNKNIKTDSAWREQIPISEIKPVLREFEQETEGINANFHEFGLITIQLYLIRNITSKSSEKR